MISNFKLRYIFRGIVLLVLLFSLYYLVGYLRREKPYEVLTPEVYEKGTTVSLYKNVPPSFPQEFMLLNSKIDYSGETKSSNGTTQTQVALISNDSVLNIINYYKTYLPEEDWLVSVETLKESIGVIRATKDNRSIIVSVITIDPTETMVTIQY